jgi:Rrf2 family protein
MLRLSKKVEYALIAMLYMSRKEPPLLTTARELSEMFHLPLEMIGKVLQKLAQKGLIVSIQGVKGGYSLHKLLDEINISDVVAAVEGPHYMTHCVRNKDGQSQSCEHAQCCNIRHGMVAIENKIRNLFNAISLKDLQN